MIWGFFAIGWAVVGFLELFEVIEPLDGTTHAISFVAATTLALLNLILLRIETGR